MPDQGDKAAQKRLGLLLRQARVELSLRYKDRTVFARETGLSERLLQDVETAYRSRFKDDTKLALELAYGWQPGSIDAVLAGGDPVKAVHVPPKVLALIRDTWGSFDDAPEHIRTFAEAEQFPEDFRLRMIAGYVQRDPARQRGGRHLREA
jgi:hypothetical protein